MIPTHLSHSTFHANGKLLVSGEYFVLDGASALALPTRLGQQLTVFSEEGDSPRLTWQSYDHKDELWFEGSFRPSDWEVLASTDSEVASRLQQILSAARQLNPAFLQHAKKQVVKTQLDFPKAWGLGTSSTLISSLADWAAIDPYQLLAMTFGGSGYDIACAGAEGPLRYQLSGGKSQVEAVDFQPSFSENLYFVYLGRKQNSREGIAHYRQRVKDEPELIRRISELTEEMISCTQLSDFDRLIVNHEQIVGESLQFSRAKMLYFSDYWGEVKSLGAWGGDFVLVTSQEDASETKKYFNEKGFEVFLNYKDLIRSSNP